MHKGTDIGLNVYHRRIHRWAIEIRHARFGHNLLLHCQKFTELPRVTINQLLPNLVAASEKIILLRFVDHLDCRKSRLSSNRRPRFQRCLEGLQISALFTFICLEDGEIKVSENGK